MVHDQRYNMSKKIEDDEAETLVFLYHYKRKRPKLLYVLLLSLMSCCFILSPHFFTTSFSHLYSFDVQNEVLDFCCDRSHFRSDICFMKGDIRTHSPSSSIFLYSSNPNYGFVNHVTNMINEDHEELQREKIKPYTRKWETSIMDTIDELSLVSKKANSGVDHNHHHHHPCDVVHNVPAVIFSTGGYTGNVYHDFNDVIMPLYITSQHLNKKVVFLVLDYHNWWVLRYGDIVSHLSDRPILDFIGDDRTHCFTEAIVGLRIHDDLTVDSSLMRSNKSVLDFRHLLDRVYLPRIRGLIQEEEVEAHNNKISTRPKLVILSRDGSRAITNEHNLVKLSEEIGFQVHVLRPQRTMELAKIYRSLNSSDVMIGVHGAAMTHFLFMRPGSVFIQVIPLGTDWAAETYYGEPARKLGLKYIGYKIIARESSLFDEYDKDDPVLRNPSSLTKKGWEYTKKIYLEDQTVRLDLARIRNRLVHAYDYVTRIHQGT